MMKIGEFAQACNTSKRMLRFYEELRLITPVRSFNGYRTYSEQDIDYVKRIMLLNHAGVPLKDIALLRNCLRDKSQKLCPQLYEKLTVQRQDIKRQIETLTQSKILIEHLLSKK